MSRRDEERLHAQLDAARDGQMESDALLRASVMTHLDADRDYVDNLYLAGKTNSVELSEDRVEWLYEVKADWEELHEDDEEWLDPEEFKEEDPEGYRLWMEGPDEDMPLRSGRTASRRPSSHPNDVA